MKKYVAHATVLGIGPGDTFESDDEFYANISKSGILEEVSGDNSPGGVPEVEGSKGGVGSSADGGGAKGRSTG